MSKYYAVVFLFSCTVDVSRPETPVETLTPCARALDCFADDKTRVECRDMEDGVLAGTTFVACNAVHPDCESLEKQCYGSS